MERTTTKKTNLRDFMKTVKAEPCGVFGGTPTRINLDEFTCTEPAKEKTVCKFNDGHYATIDEYWFVRFYFKNDIDYLKLADLRATCDELEKQRENAKDLDLKDELDYTITKVEEDIRFASREYYVDRYKVDTRGYAKEFVQQMQQENRAGSSVWKVRWMLGAPFTGKNVDIVDNRPAFNWIWIDTRW